MECAGVVCMGRISPPMPRFGRGHFSLNLRDAPLRPFLANWLRLFAAGPAGPVPPPGRGVPDVHSAAVALRLFGGGALRSGPASVPEHFTSFH